MASMASMGLYGVYVALLQTPIEGPGFADAVGYYWWGTTFYWQINISVDKKNTILVSGVAVVASSGGSLVTSLNMRIDIQAGKSWRIFLLRLISTATSLCIVTQFTEPKPSLVRLSAKLAVFKFIDFVSTHRSKHAWYLIALSSFLYSSQNEKQNNNPLESLLNIHMEALWTRFRLGIS